MSEVSNPNLNVTRQDLADFYDKIFPYLGGRANAGFTPVGTIISVMGVNAPANYLACDGTVYNISDYPELAAFFGQQFNMVNTFGGNGTTTFAVPDLRGEFLRGTGTNSHAKCGDGANVGVHQSPTIMPNLVCGSSAIYAARSTGLAQIDTVYSSVTQVYGVSTPTGSSTGDYVAQYTARPTNTSVLWCIATKNIYMNPSLDYSTDEKVVGSWVSGKPLYQKTIVLENQLFGNKQTAKNFDLMSTDGITIRYMEGTYSFDFTEKEQIYALNTTYYGADDNSMYLRSVLVQADDTTYGSKKLVARIWQDVSSNPSLIPLNYISVTIRYTKTTD